LRYATGRAAAAGWQSVCPTACRPHAPERMGDYRVLFELETGCIVIYPAVHWRDAYR
jgi:hypothetical protein